jgi:hypothetical protein
VGDALVVVRAVQFIAQKLGTGLGDRMSLLKRLDAEIIVKQRTCRNEAWRPQ